MFNRMLRIWWPKAIRKGDIWEKTGEEAVKQITRRNGLRRTHCKEDWIRYQKAGFNMVFPGEKETRKATMTDGVS